MSIVTVVQSLLDRHIAMWLENGPNGTELCLNAEVHDLPAELVDGLKRHLAAIEYWLSAPRVVVIQGVGGRSAITVSVDLMLAAFEALAYPDAPLDIRNDRDRVHAAAMNKAIAYLNTVALPQA